MNGPACKLCLPLVAGRKRRVITNVLCCAVRLCLTKTCPNPLIVSHMVSIDVDVVVGNQI